ncbi:hypothetical protein DV096_15910 [Bradymonadaceae bacterium TMQ3]|uniref:Uncharacterized protein n=1 Tax=Lujinxingia sediminis TaxID=2480984 RepID=A0ABY0CRP3_9DELT|nr:hypothetical protein [Lujinxingia sediminis]RDV36996.1 hypothetical protein DV096_15910 [Bradymonadaceae bacterium TMQ3]RVU42924.1 hypothetical protein EA187_13890 [Lujinxingia sediminis]TXC73119.1 hypothetical protein FRC91_16850 [Bradymonadales bacterium TMQ1]
MDQDEKSQVDSVEDVDVDAALDELRAEEHRRLLRTTVLTLILGSALGFVAWWIATNTDTLLQSNLQVEAGEQEVLAVTNDPVCRGIIDEVTTFAADYEEREAFIEDNVLGDTEANVDQVRETAAAFRSRHREVSEQVEDAVLRERVFRRQLNDWFGFMDNEFRILEEMADRRLKELRGEELPEPEGAWDDMPGLRDRVLLTIDENFHAFRVWHQVGLHPCGAAPEGVTPWAPEG